MKKRILSSLIILGIGLQVLGQNVNIPDANFKNYLVGNTSINTNGDSEIQMSEANSFSGSIICQYLSISDLTGIEEFTSLNSLDVTGNNLTSLDISNNVALTSLNCFNNMTIMSLDISNNTALNTLSCSSNNITSLDLSNNPALISVTCANNNLTNLDVSTNANLTQIWCYNNGLSSLDISNNPNLTDLRCYSNNLTSLNVSNNTNLTTLWCEINNITNLDVTNNTALTSLIFRANDINNIDLTNCPDLIYLRFDNNNISSLDVTNNPNLGTLICSSNNISSLDLSNNLSLTDLSCGSNGLNNLDVSNNTALTRLWLAVNNISSLDISNNTALDDLSCGSNNISDLDLSNNTALISLRCAGNNLTSLDLSNNSSLNKVHCHVNNLSSLNIANGNNSNITNANFKANINPNLTCIKVDNVSYSNNTWTNIDATTNFTTNAAPIIEAGVNQTVCEQELTTLSGSGALTYQWNNGITNNTAFAANLGTTTYIVTGTNVDGCTGVDSLVITATALPTVEAGNAQVVCNGDQVTLSGSGATTYQWDNGITNNVAFTPTLGMTTYTVSTTDGNGCTGTDDVTITVNTLPIVDAGTAQSVCEGEQITLSGTGASTYTWNNGATDNVAFIPTVGVTNYTVTGTDANGCTNSDMVAITTNSVPVVEAGPNQAVCDGETVTLSGSGAASYLWNNGVTDNVSFTPSTGSTTYSVTGTNNAGCSSSDNVTVTANELPNASTSLSGDIITADLTGANYQWLICNNSNSEITGETGTSYTATTNGDYAVIVSLNGCSDTSACVNVASVGINEAQIFNQVSVYPNPVKEVVTIQMGDLKNASLSVYSITGKIIYQVENINSTVHQFNLNSVPGVYVLRLVSNGETKQYQLIKE